MDIAALPAWLIRRIGTLIDQMIANVNNVAVLALFCAGQK